MIYNSVAEILDSIDQTRAHLTERVEHLSARQESFRPAPDAWSTAEIVEHLSIIERNLMQLFNVMLAKAEAAARADAGTHTSPADADTAHTDAAPAAFAPFSLDEFIEQSRGRKFDAPETIRPRGGVSIADSLQRLQQSRDAIRQLRPRLEQVPGHALQYPHPAFGALNLYQWLAFIGLHEQRHLAQIERLMQSPGFHTDEAPSAPDAQ